MKISNLNVCVCLVLMLGAAAVSPVFVWGQTAPNIYTANSSSAKQWSVQVERVQPGDIDLAYSFQVATYESLLEELNKTQRFKQVFRDGDHKAGDVANVLVLKTTVVKYTAGSETRRAVTTFSGATKLSVRSQLVTRDGKVLLDRTVDGNVRFLGTNLRATHNLARNIAKMIAKSAWSGTEPASATLNGQPSTQSSQGGL